MQQANANCRVYGRTELRTGIILGLTILLTLYLHGIPVVDYFAMDILFGFAMDLIVELNISITW